MSEQPAAPPLAAVLHPRSLDEALGLVQRASATGRRLRIRGQATDHQAAAGISLLVTERLDRIVDIDLGSQTVTVQTGRRIDELERAVAARGLTLGRAAQRGGHRTVGGLLAADDGGGGLRRRLVGLRAVRGSGELVVVRPAPRRAVGPDVGALLTGLRGTGLLLLEATLRLDRIPESTALCTYQTDQVEAALTLVRWWRDQDLAIEPVVIEASSAGIGLLLPLAGPAPVVQIERLLADEGAAACGATVATAAGSPGAPATTAADVGGTPRFLAWHHLEQAAAGHVESGRRVVLHGFNVEGGHLELPADGPSAGATSDDSWIALEGALIAEIDPRGTFVP